MRLEEETQHKRRDFLHMQSTSVDYALERGIQQGIQQGAKLNALETAKKMREKGFSIEEITELTGLSVEELKTSL